MTPPLFAPNLFVLHSAPNPAIFSAVTPVLSCGLSRICHVKLVKFRQLIPLGATVADCPMHKLASNFRIAFPSSTSTQTSVPALTKARLSNFASFQSGRFPNPRLLLQLVQRGCHVELGRPACSVLSALTSVEHL
uniref:Uncharacterized protein n=1 Tax=Toxoplasma gondii (strain ATCC 50861 / VEG) TaxID=432359 RepID=A0A0F7UTE5_TOXGV|nr:TPA: hypothetical protein BN1205_057960 [Toxoplasma gondii VEG]